MTEINYLEILKLCFLGGKGGCSGCPFENEGFPKCLNIVYKGIEDTINNQKAEIERLTADLKTTENIIKNSFLEKAGFDIDPLAEFKAEAVKEFAERLKEHKIDVDVSFGYGKEVYTEAVAVIEIDNLVKEMVGEG
jgi:hypothetical protein